MRILFFTSNEEDYLSDGLFHGLRSVLGAGVVDFPKNEAMYRSYPDELAPKLYGRGFSLYRTLDDIPVDRFHVLQDLRARRFDAVVISDIRRQFGYLVEHLPSLSGQNVAVLDGSDSPAPFPNARVAARMPSRWLLLRPERQFLYFKRELTSETHRLRALGVLPDAVGKFLRPPSTFRPIAFSFPEEKIVSTLPTKLKRFPVHIVDKEVAGLVGGQPVYPFASEADYYRDLQASSFGITTKRAGWDCMRHYEIAANGAVPCFRDLDTKPATCAPHGLHEGNCVAYRSAGELVSRLDGLSEIEYLRLQKSALDWVHENTTRVRALRFLHDLGLGAG